MEKEYESFEWLKPNFPSNNRGFEYNPNIHLYAPNIFGGYSRFTDTNGDQLYEDGKIIDHLTGQVIEEVTGLTNEQIYNLKTTLNNERYGR